MNANAIIDQAAAVLMTSVGKARELGHPAGALGLPARLRRRHDHWYVSERDELHSSPAIRALLPARAGDGRQDGWTDIDAFDLYSCFPSAVADRDAEIGIAEDDPRGLTVTGGLPFFGGPGNNYVTHSIAEMMNVGCAPDPAPSAW